MYCTGKDKYWLVMYQNTEEKSESVNIHCEYQHPIAMITQLLLWGVANTEI